MMATGVGFEGCSGLTGSLTIPGSVTFIGNSAFSGCVGLGGSLTFLDGESTLTITTSSSDTPFSDYDISKIYLGRNIRYNSTNSPFKDKTNITEVIIGKNVTSVGEQTFDRCYNIENVITLNPNPPTITSSTFTSATQKLASLHVPNGRLTIYKYTPYWEDFLNIVDDAEAAGIDDVRIDDETVNRQDVTIYNLQGTRLSVKSIEDLQGYPKGIYIVNGKKYFNR